MPPMSHSKELASVVEALCAENAKLAAPRAGRLGLPSRDALARVMEELRAALFPTHFGPPDLSPESLRYHVGALLDEALHMVEEQILRALVFAGGSEPEAT